MADRPAGTPSDYLAAERTLLAWIRTGIALMGFGFVAARFGLFLQALQVGQRTTASLRPFGLSFWFGTVLIVLGVVVQAMAAVNHARLVADLKRGGAEFARASRLGIAVAIAMAVLGIVMAIYVAWVR